MKDESKDAAEVKAGEGDAEMKNEDPGAEAK